MRISDWSSDVCSSDLVPTAIENCRRLQLVVRVHLLDTDCQGYVGEPGPEHHRGLMERRGAARASILDVNDRDFRETHASQAYLTTDGMLPFHDPLRYIGKYRRSDARSVGQECVSTCRSRCSPYH